MQRGAGDAAHVGHVLVLEAIDAAGGAASGNARGLGSAAAIADVAVQLGLDRSNASRMLASAVAAGLVTKTAHPADARRTELAITPPGRDLLAAARAWQDQVFARLVADCYYDSPLKMEARSSEMSFKFESFILLASKLCEGCVHKLF